MIILDGVYGKEEVTEPVLIELINSKPLQRLKNISQFGIPEGYYYLNTFSRFEHSVGVMILLRRLGAGLEEQIAGLLHDVSHTAFSHIVDWVFGNSLNEDFQDKELKNFISKTNIPEILEKHGYDPSKTISPENFSLLEKPAPDLCADRVDYTLREIVLLHDKKDSDFIFKHLVNYDKGIVFDSPNAARLFAQYYLDFNRNHWCGPKTVSEWHIFSEILKTALENNIISMNDFMEDDFFVINLLLKSNNREITDRLNFLKSGFKAKYADDSDGIMIRKKFRWVDPHILLNGKMKLSESDDEYREIIEKERKYFENPPKIKITL